MTSRCDQRNGKSCVTRNSPPEADEASGRAARNRGRPTEEKRTRGCCQNTTSSGSRRCPTATRTGARTAIRPSSSSDLTPFHNQGLHQCAPTSLDRWHSNCFSHLPTADPADLHPVRHRGVAPLAKKARKTATRKNAVLAPQARRRRPRDAASPVAKAKRTRRPRRQADEFDDAVRSETSAATERRRLRGRRRKPRISRGRRRRAEIEDRHRRIRQRLERVHRRPGADVPDADGRDPAAHPRPRN